MYYLLKYPSLLIRQNLPTKRTNRINIARFGNSSQKVYFISRLISYQKSTILVIEFSSNIGIHSLTQKSYSSKIKKQFRLTALQHESLLQFSNPLSSNQQFELQRLISPLIFVLFLSLSNSSKMTFENTDLLLLFLVLSANSCLSYNRLYFLKHCYSRLK